MGKIFSGHLLERVIHIEGKWDTRNSFQKESPIFGGFPDNPWWVYLPIFRQTRILDATLLPLLVCNFIFCIQVFEWKSINIGKSFSYSCGSNLGLL
jgi:hypothetical protein